MHKIIINKWARQSHFNNNNLAFRGQREVIGICAFDVNYGLANKKSVRRGRVLGGVGGVEGGILREHIFISISSWTGPSVRAHTI